MPEEEKQNEPMVDIDTSGPEVEVNVEEKENKQVEEPKAEEQKEEEVKVEEVKEETKPKEETEDKKKELLN